MRVLLATACLAIAALAVVALIQGDTAEEEPVQLAPPPETTDPLPDLPRGWTRTTNAVAGFAVGVPPGWSAKSVGELTTLRSPDSTVVVRVTADRTDEAINADLTEYAGGVVERLGGAQGGKAREEHVQAGYEQATAEGMTADGKRVEVIVLRRPELAAFPILVASDAGVKPRELDPIVEQLVASLRGRPAISS